MYPDAYDGDFKLAAHLAKAISHRYRSECVYDCHQSKKRGQKEVHSVKKETTFIREKIDTRTHQNWLSL